jgi:hypothetical protein
LVLPIKGGGATSRLARRYSPRRTRRRGRLRFFSKALLANGTISEAICVDIGYLDEWEERCGGHPIRYRQAVGEVAVDIVLMMDVLEHVHDDVGLVSDYAARVPHGTVFLVTVPAFQALWSAHDEFLEHRRRYSLKQAESVLTSGGTNGGA